VLPLSGRKRVFPLDLLFRRQCCVCAGPVGVAVDDNGVLSA